MSSYDKRIKLYLFLLSLPMVAGLIIVGVFFKIKLDKLYDSADMPSRQRIFPPQTRSQNDDNFHSAVPFDLEFYEAAFKIGERENGGVQFGCKDEACPVFTEIVAGIAPHHLLAADMIAEFYYNLSGLEYDTIILIGPNHFDAGNYDIAVSQYDWETPYGVLEADREMAAELVNAIVETGHCPVSTDEDIFQFYKKIFPNAKFLPVILKSSVNAEQAKDLAEKIYEISKNKKILVLGSIDFSHYKDSITAQTHDKTSLAAIKNSSFAEIYGLDIDSPASLYAIMDYSRMQGAEFELLNNSNSAILAGKQDLEETTSYVTGYWVNFLEKTHNERYPSTSPACADASADFAPATAAGRRDDKRVKGNDAKMLFFGDLMLDRYVGEKIKKGGLDSILGGLSGAGFFYGYDLISANLEGAVTDGGKHYEPIKAYDFAFAPAIIEELKKYNFNFFNIANNHLDDQGMQGATETRKNLDALGLNYSGCVNGEIGECSARIVSIKDDNLVKMAEGITINTKKTSPLPTPERRGDLVIGMIGISAVWDMVDLGKIYDMLEQLKNEADLIIVNIHWGNEYEKNFNNRQRELAHDIIDHGSDIIIGHHPHVAQGMELYAGKPIFYSLGNFVFDQYFSKETQEGFAVEAILENDKISFNLHPFKSKQSKVELMAGSEREEFLRSLSERSVGEDEFVEEIKNGQILAKFDKD